MSNPPPRRSSRLVNKPDNNPYNAAARTVLKKPEIPKRPWNQNAAASGSNTNTITTPVTATVTPRPTAPSPNKTLIMQLYNISNSSLVEPTAPSSLNASISSTTPPLNNNASVQPLDKGKNVEKDPLTFHLPLITKFAAAAPFTCIQGRSAKDKVRTTERFMSHINGFLGANHRIVQKEKFVIAYFDSDHDLQIALNLKCTYKEYLSMDAQKSPADQGSTDVTSVPETSSSQQGKDQQKFIEHEFHFVNFTDIKTPKTEEQMLSEKDRTIQVLDIPLKIATSTVRSTFAKYGTIEKITMCTKKLFQQAFITFERKDSTAQFYDNIWAVLMMRHALRVLPLNLSTDQCQHRRQFVLKLSGLPAGTLPRDLHSIAKEINVKSCVIN
jgi:hypothetical protein